MRNFYFTLIVFSLLSLISFVSRSQNIWRTTEDGAWGSIEWTLNGNPTALRPGPTSTNSIIEIAHNVTRNVTTDFSGYSGPIELVIKNGGTLGFINSSSLNFTSNVPKLIVESGGSLIVSGQLAFKQSSTHTIAGSVSAANIWVNAASTINISGSVTTTSGDFLVDQAANITLNGTYSIANDFRVTAAATFTGSPTSMTINRDFYTNNAAFTLNTNGGLIHIKRNLTTNGTGTVNIGNPMQIDGDVMLAGGPMIFNGRVTVNGKFVKSNSNTLTFAKRTTILGDAIFAGGQSVTINPGVLLKATNIYLGDGVNVVVNGFMQATNQLQIGYTPSYTSVWGGTVAAGSSGSNIVRGSGVIGWSSLNVTNNNNYIGCVNGTRYGAGCSCTASPPPYNPLDLTGCNGGILPVTISSFSAIIYSNGVMLNWKTSSEKNSDYFEVQRAVEGGDFETIGIVNSIGNSVSEVSYSFTDPHPGTNKLYYRLKQVDKDAAPSTYSDVVAVSLVESPVEIFPNPSNGKSLTIKVSGVVNSFSYSIHKSSGELISAENLAGQEATIFFDLKPGIYIIEITTSESVKREKLIVE